MATQTTLETTKSGIPPLQQGDHLTRDEFEHRYEAMAHVKKAELIEGIVYMPSPVRYIQHGGPSAFLNWWLAHYCINTPGTCVADNTTVRLDLNNEPQPDGLLFLDARNSGRVVITPSGYIEGGPELVAEIAASSMIVDLHSKMRAYARNQVLEYIVWRFDEAALDWFILRDGNYVRLAMSGDGLYKSEVFPGLWLDAAALIRGDMKTVQQILEQGIAGPEHQAFIAKHKPS